MIEGNAGKDSVISVDVQNDAYVVHIEDKE